MAAAGFPVGSTRQIGLQTVACRSSSRTYAFWVFVVAYALGNAWSGLERVAALITAAVVLAFAALTYPPFTNLRKGGELPTLLLAAAVAGSAVTPAATLLGVVATVAYQRKSGSLLAMPASSRAWITCSLVAVGSVPALLAWNRFEGHEYLLLFPLPDVPSSVKFILLAGAAVANAIYEEALWRWVWPRLAPRAGLLQLALGFGVIHFRAIPFGFSGVVIATVFACLAHLMVRQAGGSLVPAIVAHAACDLVLFFILFTEVL